jgi:hypothetical protein
MPSANLDMMYTIGPIPMEDEVCLRVSELAGQRVEQKTKNSKSGNKALKKQQKYKDNQENKIKNNKGKKEKNDRNNEGSKIQTRESKKKR